MPTKRRRRMRHVVASVPAAVMHVLRTGELPARGSDDHDDGILTAFVHMNSGELHEDWLAVRDELLPAWIQEHPGTRPHGWWLFDAPKEPVARVNGARVAQRRRLGGVGDPAHEHLAYVPEYRFGLPARFVEAWSVAYYNGRALDIRGNPIGTEYRDGHFSGLAPRRDDPPRFESQATYLERLGLLTAAERRRLPANAFDPEAVILDDVEDEHAA